MTTKTVLPQSLAMVEKERPLGPTDIRPGGRYQLLKKVGSGSFGEIYAGVSLLSGEEVAVKLVRSWQLTGVRAPLLTVDSPFVAISGDGGAAAGGTGGCQGQASAAAVRVQGVPPAGRWRYVVASCHRRWGPIETGLGGRECLCAVRVGPVPNVRFYGTEGPYNVMVMDLLGKSIEDLFNLCGRKFTLKTVLLLADQMVRLRFGDVRLSRCVRPFRLSLKGVERGDGDDLRRVGCLRPA